MIDIRYVSITSREHQTTQHSDLEQWNTYVKRKMFVYSTHIFIVHIHSIPTISSCRLPEQFIWYQLVGVLFIYSLEPAGFGFIHPLSKSHSTRGEEYEKEYLHNEQSQNDVVLNFIHWSTTHSCSLLMLPSLHPKAILPRPLDQFAPDRG